MVRVWMWTAALIGCGSSDGDGGELTPATDGTTGTSLTSVTTGTAGTTGTTGTNGTSGTTVPGTGDLGASCSPTSNALRFDCTATGDGALSWSILDGSVTLRTLESEGPDHEVTLYGMAPNRSYTWEVAGAAGTASGSVGTGSLPSGIDDVSIRTSGATSQIETYLFPYTCGSAWLVVANTQGDVVWYEEGTSSGGGGPSDGVSGFATSDDHTFVAALAGSRVAEWSMGGDRLLDATDFDEPLHHDVHVWDDKVYALTEFEASGQIVDGFYVVDDAGRTIAEWNIADHVTITGGGGGGGGPGGPGGPGGLSEWSHGNSIHVQDGKALLSLRWQNAVVEVEADPDSPNFGDINWVLTGDDSDMDSDFTWTDGGGFYGQHHARWSASGELMVFDNRDMGQDSRALRMEVDMGSMTVRESHAWSLGEHCDIQGANYDTVFGGFMVTCGDGSWGAVVNPATDTAEWEVEISCSSGGGGGGGPGGPGGGAVLPRLMPLFNW